MVRTRQLAVFVTLTALIATPTSGEDKLSLEARVVGLRGEAVEKSSILFWRLATGQANREKSRSIWRDPQTGEAWENLGGAATGDRLRRDDLEPGTYRVTASLGHHQATPVGASEAVVIEPGEQPAVVTVRLRPGPTLVIRPFDSASGYPLTGVDVRLGREVEELPRLGGRFDRDEDGRIRIEHLPPGTYRLHATRRAHSPGGLEYAAVDQDRRIEVEPGVDQEIRVPMSGRPLDQAEIEKRWGWVAVGRVTDTEGHPVEGAEVRVATGWGTLMGGGRTITDRAGRFTLRFAEGLWSEDEANVQAAVFSVARTGYVEKSRSRPGHLRMARKVPEPDARSGGDLESIILRGKPYAIDFVLAEPAILDVERVGPVDASLAIEGGRWDGDHDSAREAGPDRWELLPGQPWRLTIAHREPRFRVRSHPFTLPTAGHYRARLRHNPDQGRGVDTLEFVGFSGPDGRDILGDVVGDDPLARPPVPEDLQERGREILARMADSNRHWLGQPPEAVRSYEYRFRFAGEEGKTYRVGDDPVPDTVRHATSFHSGVHHLTAHPEDVAFRRVEIGEDRIELTYTLKEPIRASAGNGVLGTWRGFFSKPIREGSLILDARTFTPVEHRAEGVVEVFSQYAEIGAEGYLPLAIEVAEGSMRFVWTFQVFEPDVWLLGTAFGERSTVIATVDEVKVDGAEAKRTGIGVNPVSLPADRSPAGKSGSPQGSP